MKLIPLEQIPNQKFNIRLDNHSYNFVFNTRRELTYFSLFEGEEPLTHGRLCLPNQSIQIPSYKFNGVLYFECFDHETPIYSKFGTLHNLYFVTQDELTESGNET